MLCVQSSTLRDPGSWNSGSTIDHRGKHHCPLAATSDPHALPANHLEPLPSQPVFSKVCEGARCILLIKSDLACISQVPNPSRISEGLDLRTFKRLQAARLGGCNLETTESLLEPADKAISGTRVEVPSRCLREADHGSDPALTADSAPAPNELVSISGIHSGMYSLHTACYPYSLSKSEV